MTAIQTNPGFAPREMTFPIRSRIAIGALLAMLLIGAIGGWAATAKLSGAVIASGQVTVDQNVKAIQHRDGGIVSEITVREGDHVKAGQVLLRLDDAQTRSERSILKSQLVELRIRQARLNAERDTAAAVVYPADLERSDPQISQLIDGETRLFTGNLANRESQKKQLRLGIDRIEEELNGLRSQRVSKADEINMVSQEYERVNSLYQRKLVEFQRLYTVDRELVQMRGQLGEIDAAIARTKTRTNETELQILAVDEEARTKAQQELTVVDTRISEIRDRLSAISDRLSRTDIRAPISGTVNELRVHTIGGVISPAEVLVTIVPEDAKLNIRASLPPASIDQVRIGQKARLRFSAFNQRTTPELSGFVSFLSPATTRDSVTGANAYLAYIELDDGQRAELGGQTLLPGMPVEIFLTTQERTVLSYFTKPITDRFSRTFRER